MTAKRRVWGKKLRQYLAEVRAQNPIPARASLASAHEYQCRILGGHVIHWLRNAGPELIAERNALAVTRGATAKPLIVIVTDTPGLVAASQILGDAHQGVVYCRSSELEAFPEYEQDSAMHEHCELYSLFDGPGNADELERARGERPPGPGEELWIHHDETIMGPLFARGCRHLWLWNGREPQLLQEGWSRWIS